jgi:hypothetical protein
MTEDEERKFERLCNAALNFCESFSGAANDEPRAAGLHMYNRAALRDALDAYPKDEPEKKEEL